MNRYLTAEPWRIVEKGFDPANMRSSESIFSIGNGRFGQRANHEEGYSGDHMLGSYVGGVYYPDRTKVGWWKNGYPEYFAKVLNATNWTALRFRVNGMDLDVAKAHKVLDFERVLDMRTGLLQRTCELEMAPGVKVRLETERFISMSSPNRAAVRVRLTPMEGSMLWRFIRCWMVASPTKTPIGTMHFGGTTAKQAMRLRGLRCW